MKRLDPGNDWRQEYEILRQEALDIGARRGHGLALFLSRGMIAWLHALTAVRPRRPIRMASSITRPMCCRHCSLT
jgi:hypothetical protein